MAETGMLGLAAVGSMEFTGCSSTVFSQILSWIPVGISAITGIVTVLGPLVPPQALVVIGLVKAAFADLSATVTQYMNDTNPADKAGWLAKIRTILNDIVTNFQAFLDQLNLGGNPIEAIVLGLAQVVLSALAGFLGQLPAAGGKTVSETFRIGRGRLVAYTPHFYKSVNEFKTAYNSVCVANNHQEVEIH
jgi:hypothetical protein